MRHDGETGEIHRQRLLIFDESPERSGNVMTALAFSDSTIAAELSDNPTSLAAFKDMFEDADLGIYGTAEDAANEVSEYLRNRANTSQG